MPIYEYQCQQCGHEFEKLIRNDADLPSACPACDKGTLRKKWSTFAAKVESGPTCKMADSCPSANSRGGCCGGACSGH